ncbi:hypothetical protein Ae168Ps1_2909c [Pseudonocardia sp. Ae168_Ps1]|uniref:DUF4429 domain-containing protein n=1 Tax=unclassified Pseudonocardia TaxID=2619320 RepID=UPI00094B040B|nr:MULTISPECIES: DUF4429 domain-containing protein [unclassified Pseudonocardia]OLL74524.1 hypothetical protein Ae150APs1_2902c [Pseudonocardia sp. Ae150A_Ps1]OLL80503.1 hypothetical protein Ae168Ps1_2909c [Pseudonocardia sp. Ae168_Ps1]OLL85369.1 hypothetical protein Ae263Ps1_2424 [Pseudonocardia sp. Ae263_Ps1]OLL94604.1 hypothetical protein Ae356Ps1_4501c [Pseudonocardia sp. Ae356_Ps1]
MSHDLEFAGRNATWVFGSDGVRIDYAQGRLDSVLLRSLGSRTVPHTAIEDVTVSGGSSDPVLTLVPATGLDPLTEVARGQLEPHEDPYRLVLDKDRADLARYHRDRLLDAAAVARERGPVPAGFQLDAPRPPQRIDGYDGTAELTGTDLTVTWRTDAEPTKLRTGTRTHRLSEVRGVEWLRPGVMSGRLRILHDRPAAPRGTRDEDDPDVLLFGMGYGSVGDTLPFAAAVLAAAERAGGTSGGPASGDADPATGADDVIRQIEALGRLRDDGVLEPAEFEAKKKQLLDRL